ncbi:hypothetical protein Bca4012_061310 [Brassica carinata]|uniref:Uncharacterized protein n=1 Tax=Brassica carinata TaxID=52824 RepID=A0A8X7V5I9_BRACI|nr:hypothetical protein Bca52824_031608 [Brassica carinata]
MYRDAVLKERSFFFFFEGTRVTYAYSVSNRLGSDSLSRCAFVVASSDGTLAFHSMNSLVFGYSKGDDFVVAVPAYDVKFYGEDKGVLLFSCGGDDNVRGWKWM